MCLTIHSHFIEVKFVFSNGSYWANPGKNGNRFMDMKQEALDGNTGLYMVFGKRGICYIALCIVVKHQRHKASFVHHLFSDNIFFRLDAFTDRLHLHSAPYWSGISCCVVKALSKE